jgi:hypothetical protein
MLRLWLLVASVKSASSYNSSLLSLTIFALRPQFSRSIGIVPSNNCDLVVANGGKKLGVTVEIDSGANCVSRHIRIPALSSG